MSLAVFVASHRVRSIKAAFRVAAEEIIYSSQNLIVADPSLPPAEPTISETERHLLIASYPFLVQDDVDQILQLDALSLEEKAQRIEKRFGTPQLAILIDKLSGQFVLFNDAGGLARAYRSRNHRYGLAVADNPVTIAKHLHGTWSIDELALVQIASVGWVPADRTTIEGVEVLGPGTRIGGFASQSSEELRHATDGYENILAKSRAFQTEQNGRHTAIALLQGMLRDLYAASGKPISASITGGRDSRIIASLILRQGIPVEFRTTNKFDRETETVKRLLTPYLGDDVKLNVTEPVYSTVSADTRLSADSLFWATGGHYEPSQVRKSADWTTLRSSWHLSGLGGEMIHGFYYPKEVHTASRRDLLAHLQMRLGWLTRKSGLVRALLDELVQGEYLRFLVALERAGHAMEAEKFLDFFYFANRLRRWSDVSLLRGTIAPLAHPSFAAYSFLASAKEVEGNAIVKRIVGEFDSDWAEIPFFKSQPDERQNMPAALSEPLSHLDCCEDSPIVRLVFGQEWRDVLRGMVSERESVCRVIINRVLAINSVERRVASL